MVIWKNENRELLGYGKEAKMKIEGKEVKVKGDGKLEPHVKEHLMKQKKLVEDGVITDIRDPKLLSLLKDHKRLGYLRDKSHLTIIDAGSVLGRNWKAQHHFITRGEYTYSNLEIYNPHLNEQGFSQNEVCILKGKNPAGQTINIVEIRAITDSEIQRICAVFDPETGKLKENTIMEYLVCKTDYCSPN